MAALDTLRKNEYAGVISQLEGRATGDYQPLHKHFWRADYSLHRRPRFTMDVRMASTRTYRCENGNGENLKGYFMTDDAQSVTHDGITYWFPNKTSIGLRYGMQQGSWREISTAEKNTPVGKDVFKLWINHGKRLVDSKYEYYVLPPSGVSLSKRVSALTTLNTVMVQAVWHQKLQLWGATFYRPATLELGGHVLKVNGPCVVLVRLGQEVEVFVADPTYRENGVEISYRKSEDKNFRTYKGIFQRDSQMTGATASFTL